MLLARLDDGEGQQRPDDPRHAHLVGRMVKLPLTDREIPIIGDATQSLDILAKLEALSDAEVLADEQALQRIAGNLGSISAGDFESLFDNEKRSLAIARLHDAGHSPSEIASQLRIPQGEVELLLSLRSA